MNTDQQAQIIQDIGRYYRKFHERGAKFDIECPYCGDSQKPGAHPHGNFFPSYKTGNYVFHCYRCGITRGLAKFLKDNHPDELPRIYRGQSLTGVTRKETPERVIKKTHINKALPKLERPRLLNPAGLARLPLTDFHNWTRPLHENDLAYLAKRHISLEEFPHLRGTDDVESFYRFLSGKRSPVPLGTGGIVIPAMTPEGDEVMGCIIRTLSPDPEVIRYLSVPFNQTHRIVFGLDRTAPVTYVVEGSFDAMSLPNTVAALTSNLSGVMETVFGPEQKFVMLHDNEPYNKHITKQIRQSIKDGHKVVLFPRRWPKDINDMVVEMGREKVLAYIREHMVSGPKAQSAFAKWIAG